MGLIGRAAPGVDAGVAKFIVAPLTFLAAALAFQHALETGNVGTAYAGVVLAVAGLIPWRTTREDVGLLTGVVDRFIYFMLLILAAGFHATAA